MVIKIDKGVPLPRNLGEYPFGKMKKGESFAVDAEQTMKVRAAAQYFQKQHRRMKFVTETDLTNKKIRVWRVK